MEAVLSYEHSIAGLCWCPSRPVLPTPLLFASTKWVKLLTSLPASAQAERSRLSPDWDSSQSQDPHPAARKDTALPSQCLQCLVSMSTKCSSHLIKINEKTTDFWEVPLGISSSSAEGISLCMGHAGDGKVICTYKSHSCSLNSCRLRAGKEAKTTDCQTILTWHWQWADCQGT